MGHYTKFEDETPETELVEVVVESQSNASKEEPQTVPKVVPKIVPEIKSQPLSAEEIHRMRCDIVQRRCCDSFRTITMTMLIAVMIGGILFMVFCLFPMMTSLCVSDYKQHTCYVTPIVNQSSFQITFQDKSTTSSNTKYSNKNTTKCYVGQYSNSKMYLDKTTILYEECLPFYVLSYIMSGSILTVVLIPLIIYGIAQCFAKISIVDWWCCRKLCCLPDQAVIV
jgi:hypothetical protein